MFCLFYRPLVHHIDWSYLLFSLQLNIPFDKTNMCSEPRHGPTESIRYVAPAFACLCPTRKTESVSSAGSNCLLHLPHPVPTSTPYNGYDHGLTGGFGSCS
jgi:hypothetical protein